MAEWSKALDWKSSVRVTVPEVQILFSPPYQNKSFAYREGLVFCFMTKTQFLLPLQRLVSLLREIEHRNNVTLSFVRYSVAFPRSFQILFSPPYQNKSFAVCERLVFLRFARQKSAFLSSANDLLLASLLRFPK